MGDNEEQSKEISAADKVTGVPRVGIGVVVLNHENRVLIGKRKSKLGQGTWSLPGGHLEFLENLEDCARRETLEETNLTLKDVQLVRTESNFFRNSIPERHYVTVYISGRAVDESQLRNLEPDKCDDWEWVDARDILAEDGIYRPLFVPLKELFSVMGLVEPGLRN